ncbi:MAG TPA: FHA domain-containing protein [Nevskiaceae bacterium]|nr:FHA domain-containing protein [Nevskiaceae bacterium]
MGKLIITDSNGVTSEWELTKERVTVGRHNTNDIVLNDKAVSGKHAAIVTILEDSFLEDLDSTNGTQVNGQPITKHPLSDGDVITLGRNTLRFLSEDESDAMDKTMVLRAGQISPAMRGGPVHSRPAPRLNESELAAAVAATAGKPILGKLRVASGSNQGKELELTKALTTIGKPGVQVAAITRRADGYYIVHVGGGSGSRRPMVNGAEIDAQARRLAHNDTIELAGTTMNFLVVES